MATHLHLLPRDTSELVSDRGIYLRLSVTDRCNLRCAYCRPAPPPAAPADAPAPLVRGSHSSSAPRRPTPRPLDVGEQIALVEQLARVVPVRKVRITGGEPLLYPRLEELIRRLRGRLPAAELCLTTNGTLLSSRAAGLRRAGLDRVNVSIDTFDPDRLLALTGGRHLAAVTDGVRAAQAAGFERVRINTVLLRNINGDQLTQIALQAFELGGELRFIELMPLAHAAALFDREFLSAAEVISRLQEQLTYVRPLGRQGTAERHLFTSVNRTFAIGFISSVTHPFCGDCDRLRLDGRGRLHACLRGEQAVDLTAPLRRRDLQEVAGEIDRLLRSKATRATAWPRVEMSGIGG